MPELPEVEYASQLLRPAVVGKGIDRVRVLHAAHRRRLSARVARALVGLHITAVERRGKHQIIRLSDDSTAHVHFRMTGDWVIDRAGDAVPKYARVVIDLDDGSRVSLVDPRALSTITVHPPGVDPLPALGPDASDPSVRLDDVMSALSTRRTPIKTALLDQRVLAGVGNIYAAEALWRARIDPRAPAASLSPARVRRLLTAVRQVLTKAQRRAGRYSEGRSTPLAVYDRYREPCRRCGTLIDRIVQAGRSTYYCPKCQRE